MPLCRYKNSPHNFTLVFNCIREAACCYAAIRLALIFSLLYSTVLEKPLAAMPLCRYEISHHFFTLIFELYYSNRLPPSRYKISHHFFTLIFECIRAAACRYAAIRLALIFSLLYSTVLEKPLAAMPL